MKQFYMQISYNGTSYHGWQIQPYHTTIQSVIEDNLSVILNQKCRIMGTSRTDAGVHALGQTASFLAETDKEPGHLLHALNKRLPGNIEVRKLQQVSLDFHVRKEALGKHYQYRIWNSSHKPLFRADQVYWFKYPKLDLCAMESAGEKLLGTHDFSSFATNAGRPDEDPKRTLTEISLCLDEDVIHINVKGKSFLYKMVRGLCGTLLDIGRGKDLDIVKILDSQKQSSGVPKPSAGGSVLDVGELSGSCF